MEMSPELRPIIENEAVAWAVEAVQPAHTMILAVDVNAVNSRCAQCGIDMLNAQPDEPTSRL